MHKRIMIIAGEPSGDFHASRLIHALKKINPDIEISGIGADNMRRAGAELYFDISELSIIGFTGVLTNLKKIKHIFKAILEKIDAQRPDAVVLIDYPGFNLKLAQEVKKRGIKVIYYISPQIWAWWKGRIKTIQRFVDKMIVVFKFEEALYKTRGIDVSFVGHPLLEEAYSQLSREDFLNNLGLTPQKPTIGLAPGSRGMEVERILPILLESAKIIKQRLPQSQFALLKAPGLERGLFENKIKKYDVPVVAWEGRSYDFLGACDFVLVASGTATLETAIMQKPMAIVYKVSFLNWLIARCLIRLPFIGLVNVIAGKKIVPEFIQHKARASLIAQKTLDILSSQEELTKIKSRLMQLRQELGTPGASQRAAEIISSFI
ncbi:MAG: lipid-A-disaccharide synthase [Candidatus Omnitrophota bacterium]|nr:MAG: lipid-A-disaccharide synthase [Candidatus Omnitrophota bacterium]